MLIFLIFFIIIFFLNINMLYINEEVILLIALLFFFYFVFSNIQLILKNFFFNKIEYIYFIFSYLINLNILLLDKLLKNLNLYSNLILILNLIDHNLYFKLSSIFKKKNNLLKLFFIKLLFVLIKNNFNKLFWLKQNNNINIELKYLYYYLK